MEKVSLGKFIEDSYFEYGLHKNLERDFNQVYDGLKPVYRRVIYTYYLHAKDLVKSSKIVGLCMGSFHPHGDKSIYDVAVKLVNYEVSSRRRPPAE
jgi:DNA gyrase subunit A